MTSHLVIIQSYKRPPKGSYDLVLKLQHLLTDGDHILGIQQPAHIYRSLQHPAITRLHFTVWANCLWTIVTYDCDGQVPLRLYAEDYLYTC